MGYVTIAGDRLQAEFPDNSIVRFRGRIPGGLDLLRGEWEVGLTSPFLPGLVHTATPPSEVRTIITRHDCERLVGPATVRTKGVDYIKAITDRVEQRLLHELPAGQTWM